MIAITIPISESKSYCFYDLARGIRDLNFPKKDLYVVFVLDDNGNKTVSKKVDEFVSNWSYPDNCTIISTHIPSVHPVDSDVMHWHRRAEVAAQMRNLAFKFVCSELSNVSHIFSVGSDIILEPHSLKTLLSTKEDIVSALYISRIQHIPLVLSYDVETRAWDYVDFDSNSSTPFKADWTGMDAVLISKKVFTQINFDDYSIEKYGIGEDGYFFTEAKLKLGIDLLIHPRVRPIHVNKDGSYVVARNIHLPTLEISCPHCGWSVKMSKIYKDIMIGCAKCKNAFPADHYMVNRVIAKESIEPSLPKNLTSDIK